MMLCNKDYMHCPGLILILSASTCLCVLMGGYGFGKIFQPFGHGILLEKIGLLFGE